MSADPIDRVRRQLREELRQRVDARGLSTAPGTERRLRVREEALAVLREDGHILPRTTLAKVINEVSDAVVGMGPIEYLLKDPDVTEVMVNGPDDVYVEREGRIEKVTDRLFEGEESVHHLMGDQIRETKRRTRRRGRRNAPAQGPATGWRSRGR